MKKPTLTAIAFLLGATLSQAAYVLVDDFEGYNTGTSATGNSNAFVLNGGPWSTSNGGGTSFVNIANDGDNHLRFGWNNGTRAANRSVPTIADGGSGTYYFQIQTTDATPDVSFGLSDLASGALGSFGDFEVQVALVTNGSSASIGARNGDTFQMLQTVSASTWYDVWVVVDNAADNFDVYLGTGGNPNSLGTKIANDFAFRNAGAGNVGDLVTFMTLENDNQDNSSFVDNIYYNSVAVPEPSTILLGGLGLIGLLRRRR